MLLPCLPHSGFASLPDASSSYPCSLAAQISVTVHWLPNIIECFRASPARRGRRGGSRANGWNAAQCIVGRNRRVTALLGPPSCLRPDLLPLSGPARSLHSAKRWNGGGRGARLGSADACGASSHFSRAPLAKGAGVVERSPARPLLCRDGSVPQPELVALQAHQELQAQQEEPEPISVPLPGEGAGAETI